MGGVAGAAAGAERPGLPSPQPLGPAPPGASHTEKQSLQKQQSSPLQRASERVLLEAVSMVTASSIYAAFLHTTTRSVGAAELTWPGSGTTPASRRNGDERESLTEPERCTVPLLTIYGMFPVTGSEQALPLVADPTW
ncbi:uncharacterized protein FYW61_010132 isoform 2-T2 [Anableps anableps]